MTPQKEESNTQKHFKDWTFLPFKIAVRHPDMKAHWCVYKIIFNFHKSDSIHIINYSRAEKRTFFFVTKVFPIFFTFLLPSSSNW